MRVKLRMTSRGLTLQTIRRSCICSQNVEGRAGSGLR